MRAFLLGLLSCASRPRASRFSFIRSSRKKSAASPKYDSAMIAVWAEVWVAIYLEFRIKASLRISWYRWADEISALTLVRARPIDHPYHAIIAPHVFRQRPGRHERSSRPRQTAPARTRSGLPAFVEAAKFIACTPRIGGLSSKIAIRRLQMAALKAGGCVCDAIRYVSSGAGEAIDGIPRRLSLR